MPSLVLGGLSISLGTAFIVFKNYCPWDLLKAVYIKLKERYGKPYKQVYVTRPARRVFSS